MYPKSKKPSLIPRPIKSVRGGRKEDSPGVARIANTGSAVLPPLNSSTSSTIPLPLARNLTTLGVQGSVSRTPTNKRQQPRSLRPTASASRPAASASTPLDRDSIPRSSIHPTGTDTAGDSEVAGSHDPQDRLPASHPPQAPSLPVSPGVSFFESARDVRTGDFNINANNVNVFNEGGAQEHAQRVRLEMLPKHPPMSTKLDEYLPNSRQPDVAKLCERESSSTNLVLCIHGPAGIGKSTLAGHLTDKFRESGRLAASIFLGVIPVEMSEPETIVKMIGYEIGSIHPRAIPKIVEAMDRCHGTSLETHIQMYILEPLQSLGHPQPFITIMDAMDEWRNHPTFLKALAPFNPHSSCLKFILTDRLNPCAQHLPGISEVSIYTYALGPISRDFMKAYFYKQLAMVHWVDGQNASSADVEKLAELSGGLPVWASTVIALLSHRFSYLPPQEILAEIVGSRRQLGGSVGLSELYHNALMRLFPAGEEQGHFRRHMGATIALQESLSIADFSTLTGVPSHLVTEIQSSLSALQIGSPPPGSERMVHPATTLHHLSFLEYLQAPTTEAPFAISTFDIHSAIGLACVKQLSTLPPALYFSSQLGALQLYAVGSWPRHVFKGTPRLNDRQRAQRVGVDTLPKHPAMMSTKQIDYLPNSRQPDVDKLSERESTSTDLILCIHGPAGIGKTTLAGRLSDEFRKSHRLAASIFLGVIPVEMSEPETIVKMIGHGIGCIHPRAIPKIVEAMDQCYDTSLENHIQMYILEPLRSLGHPQPFIVIMDALDEWRNHPTFLKALVPFNSHSSVLKFILTDRLNPCALHLPGVGELSIYTYALGPISKEVIRAYFHKHLATVPWVDGRKAHSADVEKLTELSCGLPVWASTVIALLSHQFSDSPPHEILAEIVRSRRQVGGSDGLGELYRNGLMLLFPSPNAQSYFRRYMGAIIGLQEPLSIADFSALAGLPNHLINKTQFALSTLQIRSPPPGSERMVHPAATLHHLSLLEYLQAQTTEPSFAIFTFTSHSVIGLTCLKQLSTLPPSSFDSNSRLSSLQCYAVKYWPHHAFNGTPRSNDQWSQSEHCSTLQMMSDTHKQWAALFLRGFMPDEVESMLEDAREDDSMVSTLRKLARRLGRAGGNHWGFQVACLEVAVRIDGGDAEAWSDLGMCYDKRGHQTGNLQMNEEAVVAFQQALNLQPDPHPSRGDSFGDIARALWLCYQQNGDLNILSEAISCSRMAVTLSPTPHPDHARYLGNLATALSDLYDHDGDLITLDEVISLLRKVLALRPPPHPRHPWSLNSLANALNDLYQRNGDIKALDEAVLLHHKALALRPPSNADRPVSLSNLAAVLTSLYRHNEDLDTLHEIISLEREGLGLRPASHPNRSISLNNLAESLLMLYQHDKDIGALDECISLGREALALRPSPHPLRFTTLNILAQAYLSQFEQNRAVEVLDKAISLAREGPVLCPPDHRYRPNRVERLVHLLKKRREVTGDDRDRGEIEDWEAELGN